MANTKNFDIKKFWDDTAEGYAKAPIRNEEEYREKLKITQQYFQGDSEVLEIACGTGSTAIEHAPFVKHLLAIDMSEKMLEIAKSKALDKEISNLTFAQSSIEDFDVAPGSFDVVMAHSILHLLENPGLAIEKSFEILRPGGVFISSTVCLGESLISIWRIAIPILQLVGKAPPVKIMKRSELDALIANAGFEIDYQWEQQKKRAAFIVARKPRLSP